VEEDEEEKDTKQGDGDGEGDAELGVAAKKKVRKEKLSKQIEKCKKITLTGIRDFRSSANKNWQQKTLSQVSLRITATW